MTERTLNVVMTEETVKSSPFATVWLTILGVIFGAALLSTLILVAWPVVARYAATLH